MQISKSALFQLPSEGRITLQIPEIYIGCTPTDLITIPSNWVCRLRSSYSRPALGKESGFLFWTSEGFEANKDKIKSVFLANIYKRGTWQDFLDHTVQHFTAVDNKVKKFKQQLQDKITELEQFKV